MDDRQSQNQKVEFGGASFGTERASDPKPSVPPQLDTFDARRQRHLGAQLTGHPIGDALQSTLDRVKPHVGWIVHEPVLQTVGRAGLVGLGGDIAMGDNLNEPPRDRVRDVQELVRIGAAGQRTTVGGVGRVVIVVGRTEVALRPRRERGDGLGGFGAELAA